MKSILYFGSIAGLLYLSMVLQGTDLIYHQVVNGSPDMNVNSSTVFKVMNESLTENMNKANRVLGLASNSSNITEFNNNDELNNNDEFNGNDGVGYYDPPYSYAQCLTVFTKEMCDFRFNSD